MAAAHITITNNGIRIDVIGNLNTLTKEDIKESTKQALKMLEEVKHER